MPNARETMYRLVRQLCGGQLVFFGDELGAIVILMFFRRRIVFNPETVLSAWYLAGTIHFPDIALSLCKMTNNQNPFPISSPHYIVEPFLGYSHRTLHSLIVSKSIFHSAEAGGDQAVPPAGAMSGKPAFSGGFGWLMCSAFSSTYSSVMAACGAVGDYTCSSNQAL